MRLWRWPQKLTVWGSGSHWLARKDWAGTTNVGSDWLAEAGSGAGEEARQLNERTRTDGIRGYQPGKQMDDAKAVDGDAIRRRRRRVQVLVNAGCTEVL